MWASDQRVSVCVCLSVCVKLCQPERADPQLRLGLSGCQHLLEDTDRQTDEFQHNLWIPVLLF